MGGGLSKLTNAIGVRQLVDRAGLPLQVDDEFDEADLQKPGKPPPPSPYTQMYDERHWFTGIRSAVTVPQPPLTVYNSLSKDLHHVFQPITECNDEIEADDGQGRQEIFRVVRIPFRVAFVTGNLKLRLAVRQDQKAGKIHFEGLKEGRLISKFVASFTLEPPPGASEASESTKIILDCKIACKQLPPPPFKGLVKSVMVHKVDCCMLDLVDFHTGGEPTPKMTRRKSQQLSKQRSRNLPEGVGEPEPYSSSTAPNVGGPIIASPATSPIPEARSVHEGVANQAEQPPPVPPAVTHNGTRTL